MSEAPAWQPSPPDLALTIRISADPSPRSAVIGYARTGDCHACGAGENVPHEPGCRVWAGHGENVPQFGGNARDGYYELGVAARIPR